MTNGDRIRQMSNEELAEYLNSKLGITACYVCICDKQGNCNNKCVDGIKAYLDMEVVDDK